MLLLLVLGMMEVLVMLVVLEDLVVFVGGIFERFKSPNLFLEKIWNPKRKFSAQKQIQKSLKQSKKSTLTLDTFIALFPLGRFKALLRWDIFQYTYFLNTVEIRQ